MEGSRLNWIANFIWGVADDVLRDLYVRGKYRDVILPMTVLRRLDSLLELSQPAVLEMKTSLDNAKIIHQDQALRQAAGQSFYNTSKFTLRDLKARSSQQQLKADFEAYLDGFSPNVGVVAPLWLRAKSAYGGGRGMFEHEVSQALPVQAREAEEVPRSQLGGIQRRAAPPGRFDSLV